MISHISYLKTISRIKIGHPNSVVRLAFAEKKLFSKMYNARKGFRPLVSSHAHLRQQHDMPFESIANLPSHKPAGPITGVKTSSDKESVTVHFHDATFTFHAQWLHDAQVDSGASKIAANALSHKLSTARISKTSFTSQGVTTTLDITWNDGLTSRFPAAWLRVFAPLVAKQHDPDTTHSMNPPRGWLANTVTIPEVPYADIFPENATPEDFDTTKALIYDSILHESAAGIIKVVGLPAPVIEDERNKHNTLVTRVLKQIFGSVFLHPVRGADKTFNVSSHHGDDKKRGVTLPNYNINQVLLPHADHAHYTHPIRVQGLYALEGESENTFASCFAVLATLQDESPNLFEHLCTAPMAIGRAAQYYNPPMYQATVDTAITMQPGFTDRVKRFRWHPHLTGSLLSPYDKFPEARIAHRKFQEVMLRETHLLKFVFKPGDLYIWDNFRVLHGRQRVMKVPRTSVGQTVPEQVVTDRYRVLKINKLKGHIDEKWLVHMPPSQLYDLVNVVEAWAV